MTRLHGPVAVALVGALLAACTPATECADIGAVPGAAIQADAYSSPSTAGHSVEVCVQEQCGMVMMEGSAAFVSLKGLRDLSQADVRVVVRDQQGRSVQRTSLTAAPTLFKPGGPACEFGVARLELTLDTDGTARLAPQQ